MIRPVLRMAAVAFIAPLVSACGGSQGASSVPPPLTPNAAPASAQQNPSAQATLRGTMVTVHLPLRHEADLDALIAAASDRKSPQFGQFLTPQQFHDRFAPAASDVATVAGTLKAQGFETYATAQNVYAAAPQAVVERTFGITIGPGTGKRSTMSVDRAPKLPDAIAKTGATIALKSFTYRPHSQLLQGSAGAGFPDNRYGPDGPYWFTDLKEAYRYPAYGTLNGSGRTIAIVMAGNVQDADVASYFHHEGFDAFAPLPTIQRRDVNGGGTFGGVADGNTVEASLDVQQSLGSAPGSQVVLYDIPDLSQSNILAAYDAIVADNRADIVNSSFGLCELYYTAAYNGGTDYTSIIKSFSDIFKQGNAQGITFVASSGDHGAYECADVADTQKIRQGISNPADDPNVTAVGGTNLVTTAIPVPGASPPALPDQYTSTYVRENAFYDKFDPAASGYPNDIWGSGGGISTLFKKPLYQYFADTQSQQRTSPDVSMHMGGCPFGALLPCGPDRSADIVRISGRNYGVIGTSASSPEFAGLLAVTEQSLGGHRLGNANYLIYGEAAIGGSEIFRRAPGNNGYPTRPGYDYVIGVGTPKAAAFALRPESPLAGDPFTASNP